MHLNHLSEHFGGLFRPKMAFKGPNQGFWHILADFGQFCKMDILETPKCSNEASIWAENAQIDQNWALKLILDIKKCI